MRTGAMACISLFAALLTFGAANAASADIKCGNGTVTVSTGTTGGSCAKNGTAFICGDGGANSATGGCGNDNKASCGNTGGAGSCSIKTLLTKLPPRPTPNVALRR